MIVIRVRLSDGTVHEVPLAEDGDGLFDTVAKALGLPCGKVEGTSTANSFEFRLLHGFPPQPLDTAGSKTSRELGIQHGDTLLLRMDSVESDGTSGTVKKQYKRRRLGAKMPKTKQDMTSKLVEAFSKKAESDKNSRDQVSLFLRKAAKGMVLDQYAIRAGSDRFVAALGKSFRIRRLVASTNTAEELHTGIPSEVTYPTGTHGKTATDKINLMNDRSMASTMKYLLATENKTIIHSVKEGLRPREMCRISPGLWWSLVDYCDKNGFGSFNQGLKKLCPDVDWGFLDSRHRNLSEKAAEAERIAEMQRLEKEMRKNSAEERKRALEAKYVSGDGIGNIKNDFAVQYALILDVVERREDLVTELMKNQGINSLFALANQIPESFLRIVNAIDKNIEKERALSWQKNACQRVAEMFLEEIIDDKAMANKLVEMDIAKTVFDLVGFRVPGRIDAYSKYLSLGKDVLRRWQEMAQRKCNEYSWLSSYRR